MPVSKTDRPEVPAWDTYQRMRVLLSGQIGQELSRCSDLSEAEFDLLGVLAEAKDGSLQALALRCGLDWEKSRLSHQIGRMEKRGFVRREAFAGDGRSTLICLTDFGREAYAKGKATHERVVSEYFAKVLTPEELAALAQIAGKVVTRIERDVPSQSQLHELDEIEPA